MGKRCQLVNKWIEQGSTKFSGTINLTAGTKYNIKMEYYERTGSATAKLRWSSATQTYEIIPKSQLFSIYTGARLASEEDMVKEDILVYPNPTSGEVQIEFANEGSADISITNVTGQSIVNLKRVGNIKENINLGNHINGLYLLRIHNSSGVTTKKIVILNPHCSF